VGLSGLWLPTSTPAPAIKSLYQFEAIAVFQSLNRRSRTQRPGFGAILSHAGRLVPLVLKKK
jgi:hypothetical protein